MKLVSELLLSLKREKGSKRKRHKTHAGADVQSLDGGNSSGDESFQFIAGLRPKAKQHNRSRFVEETPNNVADVIERKYNIVPVDDRPPPRLVAKKDESCLSALWGPNLPSGPILPDFSNQSTLNHHHNSNAKALTAKCQNNNTLLKIGEKPRPITPDVTGKRRVAAEPPKPALRRKHKLRRPEGEKHPETRMNLYVEDNGFHYGPIRIYARVNATLDDLKTFVSLHLKIPQQKQKWFMRNGKMFEPLRGTTLPKKDKASVDLYVYITTEPNTGQENQPDVRKERQETFKPLIDIHSLDLIPNVEDFYCTVCFTDIEAGDGVVLQECFHQFCRDCLRATIRHSETPVVKCPFKDDEYSCEMTLLEKEMKKLLSVTEYANHEKKSLKTAEFASSTATFHCRTPNCPGWCYVENGINTFKCEVCKSQNCISCQAIHDNISCEEFKKRSETQSKETQQTLEWMQKAIENGDGLHCPNCEGFLLKKWGCDWLRCSFCKREICWVTKKLRWGPNGKGDTSGGCRCMADGRTKCHPSCNYCH